MNKCVLAVTVLAMAVVSGCRTAPTSEPHRDDQTRFEEQQRGYPDRLSSEQEARAAERARHEDLTRKP
jgi:hypothetical protein